MALSLICRTFIHHPLTKISYQKSYSATRKYSQINNSNHLVSRWLTNGIWKEKESMDRYILNVLEKTQGYVASHRFSPTETARFKALKTWYQNDYVRQKSSLIPFIKLEALGKGFDPSCSDFLNRDEISCYLEQGFVGPLKIASLTEEHLQTLFKEFHHFHKDHNRNLGSVYSMLKHRSMFDLATNTTILNKVSSILANNIMLVNMTVNAIPPGEGKSTTETSGHISSLNCHSDLSSGSQYHFEAGANHIKNLTLDNQCVNVWVSITGTDADNAPLYFFPKTHLWEIPTPFTYLNLAQDPTAILRLLAFKKGSAVRRIGLYNEEYRYLLSSRYRALLPYVFQTEVYTQPGECILFNAHCKHGSGTNTSSKVRLAITMRFNTAMTEAGGMETAGSVMTIAEANLLEF